MTVFDEKTDYSVAVELLGTGVWGGAGLDKLITFSGAGIAAFTAFMVRLPGGRYRLTLDPIDIGAGDVVAQMYRHLEATVRGQVEQWYFLHEDIPFVSGNEPAAGGKALQ
jgi:lauroyl/myristoyl acyltransferase